MEPWHKSIARIVFIEGHVHLNEPFLLQVGKSLLEGDHYASPKIEDIVENGNRDWNELCRHSNDRGDKLRQAVAQHTYNRTLDDAKIKLDEMEVALASDDTGSDLRSIKNLMKNHQARP